MKKLNELSAQFLGRPYQVGALGEGEKGYFDQYPLYSMDAFDCLTYVNTVLALFFANSWTEFPKKIAEINYRNSIVAYENRHHFMGVDWNPENARLGFVQDITSKIMDDKGGPVSLIAETLIDRPNWLRRRQAQDIRLIQSLSQEQLAARLQEMHGLADRLKAEVSYLPYIPLNKLFTEKGEPEFKIFSQIPDGAIIEIVRPNWDIREKIGTHIDVTHLGFFFKQSHQLIFRDASLLKQKVADTLLIDYLRQYLHHPSIQGINIQAIASY